VLLLHNKDQGYNNPLASFATTCLCRQSIGHSELLPASAGKGSDMSVTLSVSVGSRSRLCLDQRVCVVIVAKNVLCLAQVVFSYSVLNSRKMPLVLTINQSCTFAQPAVQTATWS